jgi:PAS domain S-box-containing protein
MNKPLCCLLAEDSENDALLLVRQLRMGGYDVTWERVDTAEAMRAALGRKSWDIVLADYKMPHFSGLAALELLKASGKGLPFIIVSGTIGEEEAVAAMKAGAHDYLMKGKLARLVPAVERELRDAVLWREHRRAEVALQESEKKYRELVEHANSIILRWTRDGRITFLNEFGQKFFGYAEAEILGRSLMGTIVPASESTSRDLRTLMDQIGERPEAFAQSINENMRRNGERVWVAWNNKPVRDEQGQVKEILSVGSDITERKQAEEALLALSSRQEAILAAVPDIIMEVDNHKVYTWANQAGIAFFGDDVIGKEAAFYFEGEQSTYQSVQPLFIGHQDMIYVESWQRRKDGERRLLAWWCRVLKDGSGNVIGALSSGRDITESKQAEEELRATQQRFQAVFEQAAVGVVIAEGTQGRFVNVNRRFCEIVGYSAEELLQRTSDDITHPDDIRHDTAELGQIKAGVVRGSSWEKRYRKKDGTIVWARVYVAPLDTSEVNPTLRIGVIEDITERKQVEEALRESQAFYHSLVDQLPAGVFRKDREGRYVFVSPWFCRLKGMKEEEFLGKTPQEVAAKSGATEEAIKYAADGMDHHVLIMQTGNPTELVEEYTDATGKKQFVNAIKIPVFSSEGKVIGTQGVLFDITARKQAEEALREEQILFTDLISTIPDHIYFKDRKSRFVRVNDAMAKWFGMSSPDEAVGKTDFDIFGEEHAWQAYEDEQRLMSTGNSLVGCEEKETWPDGHVTWMSTTKVPLRDADGNITGMVGISRNITERKQTENDIRLSESLLRATLESTADGILVVDANGTVIDYNKQFGEMWRLPESVLVTHQDQKLLDCVLEQLAAPEDFLAGVRALYAQPAKESFDTLLFKDGRVFERFSHPQRIGDRIVGRVWSFRDVTKRIQTEAHNRELAALLDNANDAIYVTALDCTILYWNRGAERAYGWTSAEVLNRKTTELLSPDLAAIAALTKVLFKQGSWSGERWQMTKSGQKVEVFSRLTLVRDEQGQPQSVFAINTDITEKRQLEAQFLRAQRLESIGALASGIAHDLNNVLAPIIIGAPLLREIIKDQTARHLLKTMETSAQRGAAIVRQVLTFARGVEGERVPVQPRHLLREIEKLADETFPKSIRVESDMAADLWSVLGDATQLHQALMNLCINARDAMPGGGVLTLEAANIVFSKEAAEKIPGAQPGSFACLRVTDTGTGIPPEIEAKIFEPFFTTKGVGKGTGLGLSTVVGIVRSHGGFIRVASKVGQGSTFELYLPATTNEQVAVKSESAPPWPRAHGEGILVVDDEAAVREVARQALLEFGYQVITAARGAEALKIFQKRHREIQVVLTDMMMPEMDGPTLVAALRVLDPKVRIVGITGMSDIAGMSGLKTLALSAMLAKPFTIEKLLAAIREALPVTAGHEKTAPDGGESRPALPG